MNSFSCMAMDLYKNLLIGCLANVVVKLFTNTVGFFGSLPNSFDPRDFFMKYFRNMFLEPLSLQ